MIIKCNSSHQSLIESYIGSNYPECLYLYLDFMKYGFGVEYVKIWIQCYDKNINAVILQYRTGMHIYSRYNDYEINEIVNLIIKMAPDMICAKDSIIRDLYSTLINYNYEVEYGNIGQCKTIYNNVATDAQKALKGDFEDIARLLFIDEGIGASYDLKELGDQMFQRNKQGFVRNYVIRENNEIACHVCTGAEENNIAIISGIVTDIKSRGKGLAKKLLAYVCKQLLEEGYEVYSVYYTKPARNLHYRVGFVDYCGFGKLYIKKH